MELNKYQEQAMTTCMESSRNIPYMFYNLLGEVGELVEKMDGYVMSMGLADLSGRLAIFGRLAKTIRKEPESWVTACELKEYELHKDLMPKNTDIQKECGDILWQLAGLCTVMGWSLEDIARMNLKKLASRQKRGKIDGDGDNR